jgi:TPR repeat protein
MWECVLIKNFILFLSLSAVLVQADNFRDAMKAFKKDDFSKAKVFFELALSKDKSSNASYMLGRMYLYGQGTDQDTKKALQYLTYAFDSGNIPSGCYISEAYMLEGTNSALLAEGIVPGLKKRVPHCKKVFQLYKNYTFPAEFSYN